MEMAYLQHRRYRPYAKWFGHGFAELPISTTLGPLLDEALTTQPTVRPDGPLQRALLQLAAGHNRLKISRPVEPAIADFAVGVNDVVRPFPVLNTAAFIDATVEAITDPGLRSLPRVGVIDQLTHHDDQLINFTTWPEGLADMYRRMLADATLLHES